MSLSCLLLMCFYRHLINKYKAYLSQKRKNQLKLSLSYTCLSYTLSSIVRCYEPGSKKQAYNASLWIQEFNCKLKVQLLLYVDGEFLSRGDCFQVYSQKVKDFFFLSLNKQNMSNMFFIISFSVIRFFTLHFF